MSKRRPKNPMFQGLTAGGPKVAVWWYGPQAMHAVGTGPSSRSGPCRLEAAGGRDLEPQRLFNPGDQVQGGKGLGQIEVSAGHEARLDIRLTVDGGEKDHPCPRQLGMGTDR